MSKKNNKPNVADTAALGKNELPLTDDAIAPAVVNPVGETSATGETQSGDQTGTAPAVVSAVGETSATGDSDEELVEITFTLSPCGFFKLPYNIGQTVPMNKNQANVIVEAGYAKF